MTAPAAPSRTAALTRHGLAVFPLHHPASGGCSCDKPECTSHGKHPKHLGWQTESTPDPEAAAELFRDNPRANVGIDTEKSGIVVTDVDPRHRGERTLEELIAELGPLPPTPTVLTSTDPRGVVGKHFYFKAPTEPIPSTTGKAGTGIDVKNAGGLVVAPGSVHASGITYRWAPGLSPDDLPLAELPAAWEAWFRSVAVKPDVPAWEPPEGWTAGTNLPDDVLLSKMFAVPDGKGEKSRDLWEGRWQGYDYPSQSEADEGLLERFAWWTNGDFDRAEALFCRSRLYRPKWAGTYKAATLNKVIAHFKGGYTGTYPVAAAPEAVETAEPAPTAPSGDSSDLHCHFQLEQRDARIAELEEQLKAEQSARAAVEHSEEHWRKRAAKYGDLLQGFLRIIGSATIKQKAKLFLVFLQLALELEPAFRGADQQPVPIWEDQICDLMGGISDKTAREYMHIAEAENLCEVIPVAGKPRVLPSGRTIETTRLTMRIGPRPGEEALDGDTWESLWRRRMCDPRDEANGARRRPRKKRELRYCPDHPDALLEVTTRCSKCAHVVAFEHVPPEHPAPEGALGKVFSVRTGTSGGNLSAEDILGPRDDSPVYDGAGALGKVFSAACECGPLEPGQVCRPCGVRACMDCGGLLQGVLAAFHLYDCLKPPAGQAGKVFSVGPPARPAEYAPELAAVAGGDS